MATKRRTASAVEQLPVVIGVMFQVTPAQRDALQDAARRQRAAAGGTGRADASRMLRTLLDEWIAGGAKLPSMPER